MRNTIDKKMLEIQKFLNNNSLEELQEKYAIKITRHQQYPHLVCLKYCQLNSPMKERVVQQCRGIILDENNNWQVVSYPYDKFFNYDSHLAPKLDWQTTNVYDKLDGSLVILYHYDGAWHVQSSGMADAMGTIQNTDLTIKDLFWSVFDNLDYQKPAETNYCFMFELVSPYLRVIVDYQKDDLLLHGVRNLDTFKEEKPDQWAKKYNWHCIKTYPFSELLDVLKTTKTINGLELEGFVAVDAKFDRVKIKAPNYVRLHHLKGEFSNRRLIEIVINNEGDEFLNYLPEYKEDYQKIYATYCQLLEEINTNFEQYKQIEEQKEFALKVGKLPYSGILFQLRANKSNKTIKEYLQETHLNKLMKLFKLKD